MRRLGILQPISVRHDAAEDSYLIISGERRYRAAVAAGLREVPCWVQTPDGGEILVRQVSENWHRAELHPFDLADALAGLRDAFGYTQRQLAAVLAKPESEVSRLLSLLKLNPAVQREARSDTSDLLTRRHLTAIATLRPEDQQEAMIEVRERRLTAVDTERRVRETRTRRDGVKPAGAPVGVRFRFTTEEATVTVVFRRRGVGADEVATALEQAKAQLVERTDGGRAA